MAWLTAMSRKTCVVPLVGQWISSERDPLGPAQADGLLQRVGPKLLPEETCRWTVSGCLAGRDDLDPGADGGAVGLLADELDGQPVVPLAGVLEQDVVVLVAVRRPRPSR